MGPPKGAVARLVMVMDTHGPRETQFCLEMRFLGLMDHACIGTHAVGPLQDSLTGQFMLEKRHFWSRNVNYPRFFGLFLDVLGHALEILSWTLQKRGARWILVVGESLHVIESTSFSSPTGLQRTPRPPGDPPRPSPEPQEPPQDPPREV